MGLIDRRAVFGLAFTGAALIACGSRGTSGSPTSSGGSSTISSTSSSGGAGGAQATAPPFVVASGPATGAVVGTVLDASTGMPVAQATVVVGSQTLTAGMNGQFSAPATTGRALAKVTAPGYLGWTRTVPVSTPSIALTVKLVPAPAAVTVGASGATVNAGSATLVYDAGAYASGTPVVAAWIDRAHVAAASGAVQFDDVTGTPQRVFGVVHVEAQSEPSTPVHVTVPVPAGVTKATAYHLDATGTWTSPVTATVAGGFAKFDAASFDDVGVASPDPSDFFVAGGSCTGTDASGTAFTANEGDSITAGSTITPGAGLSFVDPSGHVTTPDADLASDLELDAASGTTTVTCKAPCGVGVYSGQADAAPSPNPKYLIRTRNLFDDALGVRGTVIHVRDHLCPMDTTRDIGFVDVSEGAAVITGGPTISAGQEAKTCIGCADPMNPTCCDGNNCGSGCCTTDDTCATGLEDQACGASGAACTNCVTTLLATHQYGSANGSTDYENPQACNQAVRACDCLPPGAHPDDSNGDVITAECCSGMAPDPSGSGDAVCE